MQVIKSINQIYTELVKCREKLLYKLDTMDIINLGNEQDLESKNITLDKIINDIPNENRLSQILKYTSQQKMNTTLQKYQGSYKLIKRASEKIDNLKYQAKDLYFLAAQLNLLKINDQIRNQNEKINLQSYNILQDKKKKNLKFQKNIISNDYLNQLSQSAPSTINEMFVQNQYLKDNDMLLYINYYDSIHGEKQYEFICLQEHKLIDLANNFYCLIAEMDKDPKKHGSFFLIQNNFYYHGIGSINHQIDTFITKAEEISQKKHYTYQMNKVYLKQLRVVFGKSYLYRHLGGCDHQIVFKDLALYSSHSPQQQPKRKNYPFISFESKMRRRKCEGCQKNYSIVVTLLDPLKKGHNLYLCEECHHNLHFKTNNQLRNQTLTTIPYIHD